MPESSVLGRNALRCHSAADIVCRKRGLKDHHAFTCCLIKALGLHLDSLWQNDAGHLGEDCHGNDVHMGLNGDILVWDDMLGHALELSSMGIRVDKEALLRQLEITGEQKRKELYFHKRLLEGSLPLSIGGGIGQSRLCMFFLRKAHIGEIQASIWPDEMRKACKECGIPLI